MQYYSEKTKKIYATQQDCEAAELKYDQDMLREQTKDAQLKAERARRAKEVDDAYQAVVAAQRHYDEVLEKFLQDYHSYHTTIDMYHPKTIDEIFSDMCKHLT
jgi:hypothetical protein